MEFTLPTFVMFVSLGNVFLTKVYRHLCFQIGTPFWEVSRQCCAGIVLFLGFLPQYALSQNYFTPILLKEKKSFSFVRTAICELWCAISRGWSDIPTKKILPIDPHRCHFPTISFSVSPSRVISLNLLGFFKVGNYSCSGVL